MNDTNISFANYTYVKLMAKESVFFFIICSHVAVKQTAEHFLMKSRVRVK